MITQGKYEYPCILYDVLFLMGDGLKSPVDGNNPSSLPRVTCQQEGADSGLINDSNTREQALPRENCCVTSEFQSLGSVHETYYLREVVSVYLVRCCGTISVENSALSFPHLSWNAGK